MLGKGTRAVWDVAELARKAGMSYGQYVATHPPIPAPKREITGIKRFCKLCGKEFYAEGRGSHLYCSPVCVSIAHEGRYTLLKSKAQCKKCGKWFEKPNTPREKLYCSNYCSRAAKYERGKARKKVDNVGKD